MNKNHIEIAYCKLEKTYYKQLLAYLHDLPPDRQRKVKAYHQVEDKVRSILAYKVLSCLLQHSYPTFIHMPSGKPMLTNDSRHFNLSHTDSIVVAGVSNYPIGVDVEKIEPVSPQLKKVIVSGLVHDEKLLLESDINLARIWTAKEAYAKMTGHGLKASLSDLRMFLYKNESSIEGYQVRTTQVDNFIVTCVGRGEKVIFKEMFIKDLL